MCDGALGHCGLCESDLCVDLFVLGILVRSLWEISFHWGSGCEMNPDGCKPAVEKGEGKGKPKRKTSEKKNSSPFRFFPPVLLATFTFGFCTYSETLGTWLRNWSWRFLLSSSVVLSCCIGCNFAEWFVLKILINLKDTLLSKMKESHQCLCKLTEIPDKHFKDSTLPLHHTASDFVFSSKQSCKKKGDQVSLTSDLRIPR